MKLYIVSSLLIVLGALFQGSVSAASVVLDEYSSESKYTSKVTIRPQSGPSWKLYVPGAPVGASSQPAVPKRYSESYSTGPRGTKHSVQGSSVTVTPVLTRNGVAEIERERTWDRKTSHKHLPYYSRFPQRLTKDSAQPAYVSGHVRMVPPPLPVIRFSNR